MDAETRFAKIFKLISENSKIWILIFVENRVGVGSRYRDLVEYTRANVLGERSDAISRALVRINTPSDWDITALVAIVKYGDILFHPHEDISIGHAANTVGDLIDRLRQKRNDIVHSGEASLDNDDYTRYLDEIRDVASYFERVNGVERNTYKKEIDEIDRQHWADKVVKDEVQRYRVYVETVVRHEFITQVQHTTRNDRPNNAYGCDVPHPECYYCRQAHGNREGCNVM
ncbi:uncharacterized protein [Mytilus edulis]|uniref:uncharacterized protein n=1 Tax=Mytilus edulis TaxID=6550 RepID=UPI0039EFD073